MKTTRLFLMAFICSVASSATLEAADDQVILNNGLLQVVFNEQGLAKIHDQEIERTIELGKDDFSLTIDGNTIESGSIVPAVKRENDTTVMYAYQSGRYSVKVVYAGKKR